MRQKTNEALVEKYRPLVRRIARHMKQRLRHHRIELDDLEQAGIEGLIEAAPRFNGTDGASFETYVGHRVRGAMFDSLRKGDWAPRSVHRAGRDISKAMRAIEVAEQRPARECEIAERMGLSPTAYRRMLYDTSVQHTFSGDEYQDQIHGVTEGLTSSSPQPDEALEREGFHDALHQALAELPERERLVIELMVNDDLNLREAGEVLGVTESRACQLYGQAVLRLRAKLL